MYKMRVLVFDTETSGLIPKKYESPECPYILQLACILVDTDGSKVNKIDSINEIINAPINKLDDKVMEITGLTIEKVKSGVDIVPLLNKFKNMLENSDVMVAHNLDFDLKMIKIEFERNNIELNTPGSSYCTMKNSTQICSIERENSFGKYLKWPTLEELHKHLFPGLDVKNLHDAYVDSILCLRCYLMLNCKLDIYENKEEFKNEINSLIN